MADYAPPVDPKEGLFSFSGFKGLRNNVSSDAFSPEDLEVALNVDIDDALGVGRRKGYSAPVTASVDRDLWASGGVCLGVGSNALKLVNPDYTLVTLRSGLTAGRSLSYAALGDRVFYANGVESGCVQGGVSRTWGLAVPGMPVATAVSGTLRAGLYQYAVTYLRDDGQESGAGRAGTIELAAAGGIELSSLPVSTDPTVSTKAIYATSVGGGTLFRRGVVANTDTTFAIRDPQMDASPLLTQFLSPPPAGEFVAEARGHLLVSVGARLYVSEPFAPEMFDLRRSFPFSDRITMIAPLNSSSQHGVYIGTGSQVIWLDGDSPDQWRPRVIAEYGVIPGTLFYGDGELLGNGTQKEPVAFFAAKTGTICAGGPGGQMANLTQERFAFPAQDRGAGVVRRHRGLAQYVVTLRGTEVAGNVAA